MYRSSKVTEGKESNTTEECFGGNAVLEFEEDIVSYSRKICYEALYCVTNAITDPFDQQDIKVEKLLIEAAKGNDFQVEYDDVLSIYGNEFDDNRFQVQLESLSKYCK